jgi:hypothetical protein
MNKTILILSLLFFQNSVQAQKKFDLDTFRIAFTKAIDTAKGNLKKLDEGKVNYIGYFDSHNYSFTNDYKDGKNSFLSINLYKPEEVANLEPVFDEYAQIHKLTKTIEVKNQQNKKKVFISGRKIPAFFIKTLYQTP